MTFTDALAWLYQRRRTLFSFTIVGVILLIGINLFMSYAVVYVEIASPSPARSVTIHTVSEKEKTRGQLSGQLAIMSRNTKGLVISGGPNIKTQVAITIPWYGFVTKKVSLKLDKNAEKLAFRSTLGQTCPIYRPTTDSLAYYDCIKQNRLIENGDSALNRWPSHALYEIDSRVKPVRPYMGGYISIADTLEGEGPSTVYIRAVNEKGEATQYETPPGLPKEDLTSSRLFTDTYDSKNSRFVIVSKLGDIFIGKPTGEKKIDYKIVAAPQSYSSSYNQTQCQLTSENVYCYRGHWRMGEIPKGFDYNSVTASQLLTYSFADDSEKVRKFTINIPMLEDIEVTRTGNIFGRDGRYLYHFAAIGDEYAAEKITVYPSALEAGETLYYIHDKTVYAVDEQNPSVAYQVFYSSNIDPKSVFAADGKVFILGSHNKDSRTTYAYKLLDESNSGDKKRLIDVLPLYMPGNSNFYFSDMVGDQIYFSLSLPFRNPTRQQFDEYFSRRKDSVRNLLNSYGVEIDESKIIFGY